VRLTTLPASRVESHEIWEPKHPETLWATPGLLLLQFTPSPSMPLTGINLHVVLTRRTNGQILETFQKTMLFQNSWSVAFVVKACN
jgi:hypothetical protein